MRRWPCRGGERPSGNYHGEGANHDSSIRGQEPAAHRDADAAGIEYTINPLGRKMKEDEMAEMIGDFEARLPVPSRLPSALRPAAAG